MPAPRKRSPSPIAAMPTPVNHFLAPHAVRMSYRIGRSEQGVLTFEPYKSHLLPMWRFKTPDIARGSADRIEKEFEAFEHAGDFVGCDMARKFLQMGMTRSTRYANRAGGRKYDATSGDLLPKSTDHPGRADKLESARIFREAWERVKNREAYGQLRKAWENEKKEWEKEGRPGLDEEEVEAKAETEDDERRVATKQRRGGEDGTAKVEADVATASGQTRAAQNSSERVKQERSDETELAEADEEQKPKRKRRKVESKVKQED